MGGKYILSIWEPNFEKWHTLPFDYQYADAMPRQALRPKVMSGINHILMVVLVKHLQHG